jgi:hypothetical protein
MDVVRLHHSDMMDIAVAPILRGAAMLSTLYLYGLM